MVGEWILVSVLECSQMIGQVMEMVEIVAPTGSLVRMRLSGKKVEGGYDQVWGTIQLPRDCRSVDAYVRLESASITPLHLHVTEQTLMFTYFS